jgi:hypothetical protein
MKNNHFAFLIISLLFLNSCSYFSNDKEEKKKQAQLEWKKEREAIENKNYQYVNLLVSYRSNVSKDTVAIILKEYYKTYEEYAFNNTTQKLEEFKVDFTLDEVHKLDFIKSVIQKYNLNEKTAFLVFYEIDSILKMQKIEDDIDSIYSTVDDIETSLSDK